MNWWSFDVTVELLFHEKNICVRREIGRSCKDSFVYKGCG